MQIKAVNKATGEITPYSPKELIPAAILYSMRMKSTEAEIYWVAQNTLEILNSHSVDIPPENPKDKIGFKATAKGKVKLGKTVVKTDRFYEPQAYSFEIAYESAKDHLGLPDLKVTTADFKLLNPHALMKFEDLTLKPAEAVVESKVMPAPVEKKAAVKPDAPEKA